MANANFKFFGSKDLNKPYGDIVQLVLNKPELELVNNALDLLDYEQIKDLEVTPATFEQICNALEMLMEREDEEAELLLRDLLPWM